VGLEDDVVGVTEAEAEAEEDLRAEEPTTLEDDEGPLEARPLAPPEGTLERRELEALVEVPRLEPVEIWEPRSPLMLALIPEDF
jgi:hypothetical protein